MSELVNHLWQSSVCVAVIALLTLVLRNNHARTRHRLWLAASLKFLIPFSILVNIGSHSEWRTAPAAAPIAVYEISESFTPIEFHVIAPETSSIVPLLIALWFCGSGSVLLFWCIRWRRIHIIVNNSAPLLNGRELESLHRLKGTRGVSRVGAHFEPGVFGLFRPILLFPKGVADHLSDAQLDAIIAHELCHIRRRDNLTATIHMLVEAIFWFHPVVWWIGVRLTDERERACDEEVLRLGGDPAVYAEGILKICKFYLESPLPCMAGVTGANLESRIDQIMTRRIRANIHAGKKLLLALAATMAVAVPLLIGILNAQSPDSVRPFALASIKPNRLADNAQMSMHALGLHLVIRNQPLIMIVENAWNLPFESPRLSGGPEWIRTERFDIEAVPEEGAIPTSLPPQARYERMMLMLQRLLADRFRLVMHRETKVLSVYAIVAAKGRIKLPKAKATSLGADDCPDIPENSAIECHYLTGDMGRGITAQAASITDLAKFVENWTDRPVVDQSGARGLYEIKTEGWTPMRQPAETLNDPFRPTLFTVFEEMGLKLEVKRLPVETCIIEHVERPSPN